MLTRRGLFKGLLGVFALAVFGAPRAQAAEPVQIVKWANLDQYVVDTPLPPSDAPPMCLQVATSVPENPLTWQLRVDGMLVTPNGSLFVGDAGRLFLPPGTMYSRHDGERLEPGRTVPRRHKLIFEPSVCLTDAEHARLEADAAPFGIAIMKGCGA